MGMRLTLGFDFAREVSFSLLEQKSSCKRISEYVQVNNCRLQYQEGKAGNWGKWRVGKGLQGSNVVKEPCARSLMNVDKG